MRLETERLILLPLTSELLELWLNDIPRLEKELDCTYRAEPMEGIFKEIVSGQLEAVRGDSGNYLWHSFWLLIRKADRTVVGAADFKAPPNENGEVELGYGLGKDFEHTGYMTETVRAMCEWARKQIGVKHIIAETDTDGFASQRVLERCGFKEYFSGETKWWRF